GIRQTAIPLGGFSAAFVLPPIVDHGGSRAALFTLAGFSLVAALAAAATITGFVVLFLESQRGFSHGAAATVLGGMNAIAIVGRLGGGRLSDRIGSRVELMRRLSLGTALFVGAVAALVGASPWL